MQRQIPPEQVRLGMYVCGFGGAWLDHPFWRVRFVLKSDRDVQRVRESGVPFVIIDDALGPGPGPAPAPALPPAAAAKPNRKPPRPARGGWNDFDKARERSDRRRIKELLARSMEILRRAFTAVRHGRPIEIAEVSALVDEVIDTVERSPRTLLEMLRLKQKNEYTYLHSVAVCTLMINAARHMGKTEAEMHEWGLAGLLHDLGKMGVPETILGKNGKLTEEEFAAVRDHPEHGYRVLSRSAGVPEAALDVCRHHHERMDGSGYPFGLPAEAISLVARLGAVCDVYDALTSERAYKAAWTPVEAVTAMWSWEGHFDRDLLFTFMQSVAVFPPGLLVRLRSNRLALVLENKRRNSRPRVLAFYDTRARAFVAPVEVVIEDSLANDSVIAAASPEEWGFADWETLAARLARGGRSALAA